MIKNKEILSPNKQENTSAKQEVFDAKEAKEKRNEDLEFLVDSKISDINAEVNQLETSGKERLREANESVGSSTEKFESIKKSSGVEEKLNAITEKVRKLEEDVKAKMKMAVIIGMATLAISEAGEFAKPVEAFGNNQIIVEKLEKNEEIDYEKKMSELRDSIYKDNKEKFVIVFRENGKPRFLEGDGRRNFASIPFDKMEEAVKKGLGKIEIIHTHPLAAYQYSSKQVEKIKTGNAQPRPMPPSNADFGGWIQELNRFKSDNIRIENKIIDPTGEWKITVDNTNSFIKKYQELVEYANKMTDSDFLKNEFGLSAEEIQSLEKKEYLNDIHPENRIHYLKADPDAKEIAEKLEKEMTDKVKELFTEQELKDFGEVFVQSQLSIAGKISKFTENTERSDTKPMIEEYIKKAKKLGVNVSYKPFENK